MWLLTQFRPLHLVGTTPAACQTEQARGRHEDNTESNQDQRQKQRARTRVSREPRIDDRGNRRHAGLVTRNHRRLIRSPR